MIVYLCQEQTFLGLCPFLVISSVHKHALSLFYLWQLSIKLEKEKLSTSPSLLFKVTSNPRYKMKVFPVALCPTGFGTIG